MCIPVQTWPLCPSSVSPNYLVHYTFGHSLAFNTLMRWCWGCFARVACCRRCRPSKFQMLIGALGSRAFSFPPCIAAAKI